ncbi:unnamed protein product [Nezara viridula]|uniref:Uncharacterized protein n=1 Tax=Nezara viridula TaxID=85310 RepID=A0A9P0HID9_NEZVI|nr:unnamed protein product [Nezara viridula]
MWLTSGAKALSSDNRIIPAIQYATQSSIYSPEDTAAELTTAQTIIISFLYALRERDLPLIKTLLEVSSTVPQIKSSFLSVWLRDDFCFPRGDVASCLSTLGKLLLDGTQFPWPVAATLAGLDVKYRIQECFAEADDTAGQILLSTMNTCVSEGTQVDYAKELQSKESKTTLVKHVSFQLPLEMTSTGTQAGIIVHDRGISVKPEQYSTGVQTTDQSMITALNPYTLTSHSIYAIQKEKTSTGTQAGLIVYDRGVSVKPEQSTIGIQTIDQNMVKTLKLPPLTSQSIHPKEKPVNNHATGKGLQNMLFNAYEFLPEDQIIAEDRYKSLHTTPNNSYGSLLMPSQNQTKIPMSINDYLFREPKVSFKPEQSTTQVSTTAESEKDSRLSAGTGYLFESTSINAYGTLPIAQPTRITPVVFESTTAERDIFPDFLAEMRKLNKKDLAETTKTIFSSDCVHSSKSQKEVVLLSSMNFPSTTEKTTNFKYSYAEDKMKDIIDKSVPVSNTKQPISKEMANELMYSAIQKDDVKSLVIAINAGADVNHEGVMKKRPLHVAASAGRIQPAIELIHWGANVDSLDNWEETPLFVASVTGHLLMTEVLVSAGANINHMNRERNRPLHVAASAGQLEIVRLLLSNGADVDCRGESLRTPLHCASLFGHLSVIGLLLDRGADLMAVEVSGHTPLSLAKSNQQNLAAEFLHYRSRL